MSAPRTRICVNKGPACPTPWRSHTHSECPRKGPYSSARAKHRTSWPWRWGRPRGQSCLSQLPGSLFFLTRFVSCTVNNIDLLVNRLIWPPAITFLVGGNQLENRANHFRYTNSWVFDIIK